MSGKERTPRWRFFLRLQAAFFIFALAMSLTKLAGSALRDHGFWSWPCLLLLAAVFGMLGAYAILWQRLLRQISLSAAYLNKALSLLWTLLFAAFFFHERVTLWNIIGLCLIIGGVLLVNRTALQTTSDDPSNRGGRS